MGIKTFQCTQAIRWLTIPGQEIVATFMGGPHATLQQAWQCMETGEIEWRDVPTVRVTPKKKG